jgi:hypothetical protein
MNEQQAQAQKERFLSLAPSYPGSNHTSSYPLTAIPSLFFIPSFAIYPTIVTRRFSG